MAQTNTGKSSKAIAEGFSAGMPASPDETQAQSTELRHTEYFDVIGSSLKINSPEDFRAWAQNDLQLIFPHGMLACGIGQIEQQGASIHNLLTSNFPYEYVQTLQQIGGLSASPVFVKWIETRRPVLFELAMQSSETTWKDNFKQHGLQNMAAHGLCDVNSYTISYFSFSRIPGNLSSCHANLLEMLVPHLHVALIRAFAGVKNTPVTENSSALSKREFEILQCLSAGKSNLEISHQLYISEFTVKNHVKNILAKLNVKTRAQAVAKTSRPLLAEADHIYALDLTPLTETLPKHQAAQTATSTIAA